MSVNHSQKSTWANLKLPYYSLGPVGFQKFFHQEGEVANSQKLRLQRNTNFMVIYVFQTIQFRK